MTEAQLDEILEDVRKLALVQKKSAKQQLSIDSLFIVIDNWIKVNENDSLVINSYKNDVIVLKDLLKASDRKRGLMKIGLISVGLLAVLEGVWIVIQSIIP